MVLVPGEPTPRAEERAEGRQELSDVLHEVRHLADEPEEALDLSQAAGRWELREGLGELRVWPVSISRNDEPGERDGLLRQLELTSVQGDPSLLAALQELAHMLNVLGSDTAENDDVIDHRPEPGHPLDRLVHPAVVVFGD